MNYSKNQIDNILDRIENYSDNKKYKSLLFTARAWLSKEKPEVTTQVKISKPVEITEDLDFRVMAEKHQEREELWKGHS